MRLNNCCYKALKHHEISCPVCRTEFYKPRKPKIGIEVEANGQIALLFGKPKQLVIHFNQYEQ